MSTKARSDGSSLALRIEGTIHHSPLAGAARRSRAELRWHAVVDALPLHAVICTPAGKIRAISALARTQLSAIFGPGKLVGRNYAALMAKGFGNSGSARALGTAIRAFLAGPLRPQYPVNIAAPTLLKDFLVFGVYAGDGDTAVFYHLDPRHGDRVGADHFVEAAIVMAQDEERKRIGRELHDDLCQRLSLVKLNLSKAMQADRRRDIAADLAEASEAVGAALDHVRNLTYFLHPPGLEQGDIGHALHYLCRDLSRRTGLEIEYHNLAGSLRRYQRMENAFYRVAQEALSNVIKHASADRAIVSLRRTAGRLILEIEDDGTGISEAVLRGERSTGLGIWSMRERLGALSGKLKIERRGPGTKLTATIPWRRSTDA